MKKLLYSIIIAAGILGNSSCSDMMDTESTNFVSNPEIGLPSDSVFYAFGIMNAIQELADQYYLQNELRGDLVQPTQYATTDVRNMATFNAGTENKYDSVYQYYKVINNCNYYLANRDTTLVAAGVKIALKEYFAIAAYRAWTYLQLTTQYGNVPYITTPVLTQSEINAQTTTTDYKQILEQEAENLQAIKDTHDPEQLIAPQYDRAANGAVYYFSLGNVNYDTGSSHSVVTQMCFIPFNLVLGDLYLELGRYDKAVQCYYDYLVYAAEYGKKSDYTDASFNTLNNSRTEATSFEWPTDFNKNFPLYQKINDKKQVPVAKDWDKQFYNERNTGMMNNGIASYIPMAVNFSAGVTTTVPSIFGYDFYSNTSTILIKGSDYKCPQKTEMMVVPSASYNDLSQNSTYYYWTNSSDNAIPGADPYKINSMDKGDARANQLFGLADSYKNTSFEGNVYVNKPSTGYFYLYRTTSVYMRIAECFNRMGYPELAFGILKTGLNVTLSDFCPSKRPEPTETNPGYPERYYYMPEDYITRLETGMGLPPFFQPTNMQIFTLNDVKGIHTHGAGATAVSAIGSPYTYKDVVEKRIDDIRAKFGVGGGEYTDKEYINAMEDLLCDEYAMEFAFEGRRFSDLLRLARHKNESSPYGAAFGDRWLSDKLSAKKAGITTKNCYLPFK